MDAKRIAAIVARIKREIEIDVGSGVLPEGPLQFADLHTYVDANEYGGLCADNADIDTDQLVGIQETVEAWLLSGARNVQFDRPWLGVRRQVHPRDLAAGQWIHRTGTHSFFGDWYKITHVQWHPVRSCYYIRFDRPHVLRYLLANHYYLTPTSRETIREPRVDTHAAPSEETTP